MDKFVLIGRGTKDNKNKSIIRIKPSSYDKIYDLKLRTGISMCTILEQCIDFALEHMDKEDEE